MATAEVGALRVTLGLDSGQFTDGLNKAQKQLKAMGSQMQSVGRTMATVGAGMTAALTAPLIALGIKFGKAAIEAEEMQSAFNVSFGAMAADTKKWAQTTGDALGRSTFELQEMALGFNGLFKAGGPVTAQAAGMSKQFTTLAQDLSSFHNIAQDDVFAALRSGLSGEAEPLRRFNVYLTEAAVSAEAMRLGLNKTGGALSEQAKIQARASLIMKGTVEAQGDVARTASSTQNQLRTLQSQWAELSVTLGQKILPLFTPIVAKLNEMATAFSSISPQMQSFVLIGGAIAAVLGPALIALGAVVAALGSLAAAFAAGGVLAGLGAFAVAAAPFVAAAAAIAAAVYIFRDQLFPIFKAFKDAVMAAVGPYLPDLLTAAKAAFAALGPAIVAIKNLIAPVLKFVAEAFAGAFGPILITMLKVMVAQVTGALQIIGNILRFVSALLTGDWKGAWNAAGSVVLSIVKMVGSVIDAVFPGITAAIGRMVTGVTSWLSGKLFAVLDGVIGKVKVVGDAFFKLYDAVVGHSYVPDMVEGVAEWMAKLDAGMVVPAKNATDAVASSFEKLRDDVAAIMERLMTDAERAARALAQDTKTIQDAVKAGQISPTMGRVLQGGVDAEGMTKAAIPSLNPLGTEAADLGAGLKDSAARAKAAVEAAAQAFGDKFENAMNAALHGDWQGVLQSLLGDSLQNSLRSLGASLFKSFSGGGSGGGIFSSIASLFSKGLPGFKTGGGFTVGGNGGIDSSIVSFRATPGEMVDIRKPGQSMSGGTMAVHVVPSPYFNVQVEKVASGPATRAGYQAVQASRQIVPSEQSRRARFALGQRA